MVSTKKLVPIIPPPERRLRLMFFKIDTCYLHGLFTTRCTTHICITFTLNIHKMCPTGTIITLVTDNISPPCTLAYEETTFIIFVHNLIELHPWVLITIHGHGRDARSGRHGGHGGLCGHTGRGWAPVEWRTRRHNRPQQLRQPHPAWQSSYG